MLLLLEEDPPRGDDGEEGEGERERERERGRKETHNENANRERRHRGRPGIMPGEQRVNGNRTQEEGD